MKMQFRCRSQRRKGPPARTWSGCWKLEMKTGFPLEPAEGGAAPRHLKFSSGRPTSGIWPDSATVSLSPHTVDGWLGYWRPRPPSPRASAPLPTPALASEGGTRSVCHRCGSMEQQEHRVA